MLSFIVCILLGIKLLILQVNPNNIMHDVLWFISVYSAFKTAIYR